MIPVGVLVVATVELAVIVVLVATADDASDALPVILEVVGFVIVEAAAVPLLVTVVFAPAELVGLAGSSLFVYSVAVAIDETV